MAKASSRPAEIVQASRDMHGEVGRAVRQITEHVFRDAADFDPGNGMFSANPDARQFAVAALLTRS